MTLKKQLCSLNLFNTSLYKQCVCLALFSPCFLLVFVLTVNLNLVFYDLNLIVRALIGINFKIKILGLPDVVKSSREKATSEEREGLLVKHKKIEILKNCDRRFSKP